MRPMLDPSFTVYLLGSSLIAFAALLAWRTVFAFSVMAALSSTTLIFWGWWAWSLRDGMGPDSIESRGAQALVRFLGEFWIPATFRALLIGTGLIILKAASRRRTTKIGAHGS